MILLSELSPGFVVLMGMGTVFFGLICIIVLIWLVGQIIRAVDKGSDEPPVPVAAGVPTRSAAVEDIPNRTQFVAAVSAVIAEEMGTDVSKLRILSIKKL